MKKKIIIAATFTACLALYAAVSPQSTTIEKTPAPNLMPAVTDSQPALPEPEKLEIIVTTEKETVKASEMAISSEATTEGLSVPASETENNPKQSRKMSQSLLLRWYRPQNWNMNRHQKSAITARRIWSMSQALAG